MNYLSNTVKHEYSIFRNPLLSCADEVGIPSLYLDYAWRDGEPKYKP